MVQLLFDGPTGATESCPRRVVSVTPLSALFLLNNPFPRERAKAFAARVRDLAGNDAGRQCDAVFRLGLGRLPTADERTRILNYLDKGQDEDRLEYLCQVIFCANEFTTLG
jgi:hypothetical protein